MKTSSSAWPEKPARSVSRRKFLSTTASAVVLSQVPPSVLGAAGGAKPVVAIVKGTEVGTMVAEAMELLGGLNQFVKDGQKVTLKPNCVHQPELRPEWQSGQPTKIRPAFTTHMELTEAFVQQLQKAAKCAVTIAEGTPESASRLFDYLGYTEMAKRNNVKLVDVDKAPRTEISLPDGLANDTYELPVATQNCDVFFDLPVLKNHHVCGVSAGMKNLFGLLPMPKANYHKKLNGVLCDLVKATKPALTLVDALYGMEGQGPLQGKPVKMDLVVAGSDIVAVDAVCTALMGFDPQAVEYLVLANQKGLGEIELNNITIKGTPLAQVRRQFKHAKWITAMVIDQTEPAVKTLGKLAAQKWEDRGGQSLLFGPELLKVNSAKYPQRKSFGFSAWYRPGEKVIMLEAQYEVLIHAHRKAAEEEMRQWLKANLGEDVEPKMVVDF